MTFEELAKACIKQINMKLLPGMKDYEPRVTLVMPAKRYKGETRRLTPRGKSPIGKLLSTGKEHDLVSFNALDLLAWTIAKSDGKVTFTYALEDIRINK